MEHTLTSRRLGAIALLTFGIFTVYAAVLVPAYNVIVSDIMLSASLLLDAVDLLLAWFELFGSAAVFAVLILSVRQFSLSGARPVFWLCGGAFLYKYVVSIIALSVVYRSFDATANYLSYVVSYLMDVGGAVLVVWLTQHFSNAETKGLAADALSDYQSTPIDIKKPFCLKNPMQRTALLGVLLLSLLRLVAFIIEDITYWSLGVSYEAVDFLVMPLYWILLIFLPAGIAYILTLLLFVKATEKKDALNG